MNFRNKKCWKKFLIEIDTIDERSIRKIMGNDYIDTPGFYKDSYRKYKGVEDFYFHNMSQEMIKKLQDWWSYKYKVVKFATIQNTSSR